MKRYEYFQVTSANISDDNWRMMLDEHGSQGWELSSVVLQETSKIMSGQKPDVKYQKENDIMQTNYFIIFKREY
jgi:SH3-like domain-containing protein